MFNYWFWSAQHDSQSRFTAFCISVWSLKMFVIPPDSAKKSLFLTDRVYELNSSNFPFELTLRALNSKANCWLDCMHCLYGLGRSMNNFWLCPWIMICILPGPLRYLIYLLKTPRWPLLRGIKKEFWTPRFVLPRQISLKSEKIHSSCLELCAWTTPLDHTRFHYPFITVFYQWIHLSTPRTITLLTKDSTPATLFQKEEKNKMENKMIKRL